MRQPEFWSGQAAGRDAAPMVQALLAPLGLVYGWGAAARRAWTNPTTISVPLVCIGNLTLGGAGKTPVTRAVRRKLGEGVHVLSRGYGGAAKGPLQVDPRASFREVGDEPLLHAADGPAWIARDRVAGAQAAIAAGARAIVMDDGFQNPTLKPDLSIVVIDAETGLGNRKVFPAGPLRERAADGLKRAHAILLQASSKAAAEAATFAFDGPILRGWLEPTAAPPPGPLVAFAGIARPRKFFDALRAHGAAIEEEIPYPDHHVFTAGELDWLATIARERGARLVTTEKDYSRLDAASRERVSAWPVEARFLDEAALDAFLAPIRTRMS